MEAQPVAPHRIVVMARPSLARQVEAILRSDGHQVYRTPDDASLVSLVARIRAHLVIIALDIPWADSVRTPRLWIECLDPVPVLLIGEDPDDVSVDGIPRLSVPLEPRLLRTTVGKLLELPNVKPEE